jgi:hypothetical protein
MFYINKYLFVSFLLNFFHFCNQRPLGPLVVRNSSMASLYYFSNLVSVGSNGDTVNVEGKNYTVVIDGMPCFLQPHL